MHLYRVGSQNLLRENCLADASQNLFGTKLITVKEYDVNKNHDSNATIRSHSHALDRYGDVELIMYATAD